MIHTRFFSLILPIILLAVVLPLTQQTMALHSEWQDHYTDATGIKCCGVRDCIRTIGRLLDRTSELVQVEVQGIPLWMPAASVHNSEDGAFWVCVKHSLDVKKPLRSDDIRCVFIATGT